jgi:hypothetical protein
MPRKLRVTISPPKNPEPLAVTDVPTGPVLGLSPILCRRRGAATDLVSIAMVSAPAARPRDQANNDQPRRLPPRWQRSRNLATPAGTHRPDYYGLYDHPGRESYLAEVIARSMPSMT